MPRVLELVIRSNGDVDLMPGGDEEAEPVWQSDGDEDFLEFLDADFAQESDIEDILSYLEDSLFITENERESFENGEFDIFIEEGDETPENDEDDENPPIEAEFTEQ